MKIEIAGVDYQKTPIEIREKFSFTASAVSEMKCLTPELSRAAEAHG